VSGSDGSAAHVEDSLGPYLLGALGGVERDAVEAHLAWCESCLTEASELGAVVDALAVLPAADVPKS
jgi:anti-sigma factor RsiW